MNWIQMFKAMLLVEDSLSLTVFIKSTAIILKLLTFFSENWHNFYVGYIRNFNVLLTNDVVRFEHLGPVVQN